MKLKPIVAFAKWCAEHGYEWIEYDEDDSRICLTVLVNE